MLCKCNHGTLCCDIDSSATAGITSDRSNIDNGSGLLFFHHLECASCDLHRSFFIDGDNSVKIFIGIGSDRIEIVIQDTSVVDQNIKMAEFLFNLFEQMIDIFLLGNIAFDCENFTA